MDFGSLNKRKENEMEVRILAFYSYKRLDYWFKKIRKHLETLSENKKIPTMMCKRTLEECYIDFGTQRWIFLVPCGNNLIGRRGPIYHGTEYLLEEDFRRTILKIWKGE